MAIDDSFILNADPNTLLLMLIDPAYTSDAHKAQELEPVLAHLFDMLEGGALTDEKMISDLLQCSDELAKDFGLPSAVEHFKQHKDKSKWKGFDGAELKFDMKGFHENLQNKIIEDVTGMSNSDKVKDEKDGKIVGIKVGDAVAKANLETALAHLAAPQVEEASHDIFRVPRELLVDVGWAGWQSTWDSYQKTILAQKTPEDMGRVFCEQTLLLPFTMFAKTMGKLDDWVIAQAKKSKAARGTGKGGAGTAPKGGSEGAPSDNGGNGGPSGPDDGIPMVEAWADDIAFKQLQLFRSELVRILQRDGRVDPARRELGDALEQVMYSDDFTMEKLQKEFPDLAQKMWDDMPYLLADPKNKEFKDLVLKMVAIPEETRELLGKQAANIGNGLTPDGKSVINKDSIKLPEIKTGGDVKKAQENVESRSLGKGKRTTYKTPKGNLVEDVFPKADGGKTVITKVGDLRLKQEFDKNGKVVYQTLQNNPPYQKIGLKEPNQVGLNYNGHMCDFHDVSPEVYQARLAELLPLVDQVTAYKDSLKRQEEMSKIKEPITRTVKKSDTLSVQTEYYPKQNRIVQTEIDRTKGVSKNGMETVTEILLNEGKMKTHTRWQDKDGKMHYGDVFGTVERVAGKDGTISKQVTNLSKRDREIWEAAMKKEVAKELKKLDREGKISEEKKRSKGGADGMPPPRIDEDKEKAPKPVDPVPPTVAKTESSDDKKKTTEEFIAQADKLSAKDKGALLGAIKDTLANQVVADGTGDPKAKADLEAARERVGAILGKERFDTASDRAVERIRELVHGKQNTENSYQLKTQEFHVYENETHTFGVFVDPARHSITRFSESKDGGALTAVTYFPRNGKISVLDPHSKEGKYTIDLPKGKDCFKDGVKITNSQKWRQMFNDNLRLYNAMRAPQPKTPLMDHVAMASKEFDSVKKQDAILRAMNKKSASK